MEKETTSKHLRMIATVSKHVIESMDSEKELYHFLGIAVSAAYTNDPEMNAADKAAAVFLLHSYFRFRERMPQVTDFASIKLYMALEIEAKLRRSLAVAETKYGQSENTKEAQR